MPAKQVHCRECRQLLNPELSLSSVEIPAFVPLQELEAIVDVVPKGVFTPCPKCSQELRIAHKYLGNRVQSGALHGDGLVLVPNVEFGEVVVDHQADEFLELSNVNHVGSG